jgi:hypothetical protein
MRTLGSSVVVVAALASALFAGMASPTAADTEPPTPPGVGGPATARPVPLERDALRTALAGVPALAPLAAQFEPFSASDVDAALRRGGRSRQSIHVWTFMPAAFAWMPRAGRELLVVSGRAGGRALIAVLEVKSEQRFDHVASLFLHEADATVAVGHSEQHPDQLVWSSCYGCAGEGGTIRSLPDGRVEFGYR